MPGRVGSSGRELVMLATTAAHLVPLSSSFFAGRLLNCLHHEVKSRRDEAGSGVATGAGWGSPLRTRGVWGLVCVPAGAMAGSMVVRDSRVDSGPVQVQVGPKWAGGSCLGAAAT